LGSAGAKVNSFKDALIVGSNAKRDPVKYAIDSGAKQCPGQRVRTGGARGRIE
jgi:hypothetical protein